MNEKPISLLIDSLPKSLDFYTEGLVQLDQVVVDDNAPLELDGKQVVAFQIHGDFKGWFFVLADQLLDAGMVSELGNCLAAGFANRIADELTEISPPIYPKANQMKRICDAKHMLMRAEYFAHWKENLVPVQVWISGSRSESEIRV